MGGALATTAAMAGGGGCQVYVQLKARNVSWIGVVGRDDVWLDRALGWGRANGVGLPKTEYRAGQGMDMPRIVWSAQMASAGCQCHGRVE